jgi:hypothetical protein
LEFWLKAERKHDHPFDDGLCVLAPGRCPYQETVPSTGGHHISICHRQDGNCRYRATNYSGHAPSGRSDEQTTGSGTEALKPKKGHTAHGTVKKVDASASTLTIAIKKKKEATDKDFTVTDTTKVTIYSGKEKTELTGKDCLKDDLIKENTKVKIVTGPEGIVKQVVIGTPAKTVKKTKKAPATSVVPRAKATADERTKTGTRRKKT